MNQKYFNKLTDIFPGFLIFVIKVHEDRNSNFKTITLSPNLIHFITQQNNDQIRLVQHGRKKERKNLL